MDIATTRANQPSGLIRWKALYEKDSLAFLLPYDILVSKVAVAEAMFFSVTVQENFGVLNKGWKCFSSKHSYIKERYKTAKSLPVCMLLPPLYCPHCMVFPPHKLFSWPMWHRKDMYHTYHVPFLLRLVNPLQWFCSNL